MTEPVPTTPVPNTAPVVIAPTPAPVPVAPKASLVKKILRGVLAAFTSPEAIKQEKSLAALVLTRLVTQAGGGGAAIYLIAKLLGA